MLTESQRARIPYDVLKRNDVRGATSLINWLKARGLHMTLLELENERRARGIR